MLVALNMIIQHCTFGVFLWNLIFNGFISFWDWKWQFSTKHPGNPCHSLSCTGQWLTFRMMHTCTMCVDPAGQWWRVTQWAQNINIENWLTMLIQWWFKVDSALNWILCPLGTGFGMWAVGAITLRSRDMVERGDRWGPAHPLYRTDEAVWDILCTQINSQSLTQ